MDPLEIVIPNQANDGKPYLLRKMAVTGMCFMVLLSFAAVNLQSLFWQASDWLVGAVLPAVVVDLTNKERDSASLAPLQRSNVLDEAARLKAEDMATNSYFSHYSPTGVSPWHWFALANYPFVHAGENLAVHFNDSGKVVDAWMNSPKHKENIVNGKYQEIGVGTARGTYDGHDTVFVVQLFGTRANTASQVTAVVPKVEVEVPQPPAAAPTTSIPATTIPERAVLEINTPPATTFETSQERQETSPTDTSVAGIESFANNQGNAQSALPMDTHVEVDGNIVSIYSETVSSSTDMLPLVPGLTAHNERPPLLGAMAVQPNQTLQWFYIVLALFVSTSLVTSVVWEWRRQRPLQVAYGTGLLLLMCGLYYVHTIISGSVLIV